MNEVSHQSAFAPGFFLSAEDSRQNGNDSGKLEDEEEYRSDPPPHRFCLLFVRKNQIISKHNAGLLST